MDINKLLCGIDCKCGKKHTCNIEYVYIEKGAAARLEKICYGFKNLLIVADQNTFAAAGSTTLDALKGKNIKKVIFDGGKILIPNEEAINTVTENLHNIDMIVGIGSGVIQDLCKYVSYFNNLPYIIVATAPSMDGYASNGAAMITDGMKVTYPAALPKAILADTEVLVKAPLDMLKAGFGDIIGKFSALNDWKLSHTVNGEYFCDYIYDLTFEQIKTTLDLADGILKRDQKSVKALMEALVVIGILMSFAGSSRPASGSEHHLSHFFEITGIITNTEYFPHGIDVAYSTVITAKLREKLLSDSFPAVIFRESKDKYVKKLKQIYKDSAEGCIKLQEKIGRYENSTAKTYLENESQIREILAEMPKACEIENMLSKVGLCIDEFYTLYGKERINTAVAFAKDLKDRYTVLWMYYDFYGDKPIEL